MSSINNLFHLLDDRYLECSYTYCSTEPENWLNIISTHFGLLFNSRQTGHRYLSQIRDEKNGRAKSDVTRLLFIVSTSTIYNAELTGTPFSWTDYIDNLHSFH